MYLIVSEVKIKIALRFHLMPSGMVIIKRKQKEKTKQMLVMIWDP